MKRTVRNAIAMLFPFGGGACKDALVGLLPASETSNPNASGGFHLFHP
jgi:hypothetical protein